MKVLNVCRVLWTGGIQRVSIGQTDALRRVGVDCDLVFLRSVDNPVYALPKGTRIVLNSDNSPNPQSKPLFRLITSVFAGHRGEQATVDLDLIWGLRELADGYDVIVFNDQYAALLGAYLRLIKGKPYVMVLHEFYPKVSRSLARRLFFPVADLIDAFSVLVAPSVLTTSEKVQRRIDRIAPGKATLARIGFPVADPLSLNSERARRTVLALTVWDEGRHPEFFATLAKTVPEFKITLMGMWASEPLFRRFKGLERSIPNLEITGPVTEEERCRRLKSTFLYASFGYSEAGPGMGGLEALAMGCPVLVNRGIGLSELIVDRVNGFVVDPFDVRTVARKLRLIDKIPDEELYRIRAAGQSLCRTHTWTAHALLLEGAIKRACRSQRRVG